MSDTIHFSLSSPCCPEKWTYSNFITTAPSMSYSFNNLSSSHLTELFLFFLHSAGAQAVRNAHFGEGTDGAPLLSDLSCTGEEEHILQCPSSRVIGVTGYPHSQDAGVICRQCMTQNTLHCHTLWRNNISRRYFLRNFSVKCKMLGVRDVWDERSVSETGESETTEERNKFSVREL